MKLVILFEGDRTVGIFPQSFTLDCPFEKEDVCEDDLEEFKRYAIRFYRDWTDTRIGAMYDFEIQNTIDNEH